MSATAHPFSRRAIGPRASAHQALERRNAAGAPRATRRFGPKRAARLAVALLLGTAVAAIPLAPGPHRSERVSVVTDGIDPVPRNVPMFDPVPQPVDLIPPGTVVPDGPPEGWTHLLVKCRS